MCLVKRYNTPRYPSGIRRGFLFGVFANRSISPHEILFAILDREDDVRLHSYDLRAFERAQTHDPIWNTAQRQLTTEGRLHNQLRMLWGKKILEWSPSPEHALATMIYLNDKYALDGRAPNSYSGIAWCLGRYDRPWGPKRSIFGSVRFMSSESAKRKLRLSQYLDRYANEP